jgi:hypothetical protein
MRIPIIFLITFSRCIKNDGKETDFSKGRHYRLKASVKKSLDLSFLTMWI